VNIYIFKREERKMTVMGKEIEWIVPLPREDGESLKLYCVLWKNYSGGTMVIEGDQEITGRFKVVGLIVQEEKKRKKKSS
jgi:hypothetical protein